MTVDPPPRREGAGPVLSRRRVLQLGLVSGAAAAVGPGLARVTRGEADPRPRAREVGRGGGPGAPTGLRTSGLAAPVGLGPDDVFFSWHVDDAGRGAVQSAYRVVVTGPGRAVVWDSGRVVSASQAFSPTPGRPSGPTPPTPGRCGPGTVPAAPVRSHPRPRSTPG